MKPQNVKRTFIVDDDPFWRSMLSQMLTDLGYTNIDLLSNGAECINNLNLAPNLIFLDYQMEDMDGLEVLAEVMAYLRVAGPQRDHREMR